MAAGCMSGGGRRRRRPTHQSREDRLLPDQRSRTRGGTDEAGVAAEGGKANFGLGRGDRKRDPRNVMANAI